MGWGTSGVCSDTGAVKRAPLGTRFPHFCPKAAHPELRAQQPLSKEGSTGGWAKGDFRVFPLPLTLGIILPFLLSVLAGLQRCICIEGCGLWHEKSHIGIKYNLSLRFSAITAGASLGVVLVLGDTAPAMGSRAGDPRLSPLFVPSVWAWVFI